jgi:plastocyanin
MERLARALLLLLLLVAVAIPFGGRWLGRAAGAVEIRARMAEDGGWSPRVLNAQVGEPLELRLTSDDVVHGFAVGHHHHPEVEVEPGKWVTVSLIFDEPGTYTYYCTRWCRADHWRMRGIIEVSARPDESISPPSDSLPVETGEGGQTVAPPRYMQFGIDLDAPKRAEAVPETTPVAERGEQWGALLPAYAVEDATYWSHSPAELWARLRGELALRVVTDSELWDAVAWVWARQTTPEALAEAERIYRQEGAAAHGESGRGDGVMVEQLPDYDYDLTQHGDQLRRPPDFTDPYHTLGASPARLEGKMLRGGMGTGMPSYGEIYTQDEIEALVAFIFTFVMDLGQGLGQ